MSSEDSQTPETVESTPESEATEAEAPPSDDDAPEGDDDDAPEGDDDDKKKKKDKPKKIKINFEATMPRAEAVSYFESIVGGLKSGRLEFRQEGETLVLNPPDQLEIGVKASRKGDKGKVVFEIEWSAEQRPLEISN